MCFFGQNLRILSNYLSCVPYHQTGWADIGHVKIKPAGHMCGNTPENAKPHQMTLMGIRMSSCMKHDRLHLRHNHRIDYMDHTIGRFDVSCRDICTTDRDATFRHDLDVASLHSRRHHAVA